MQKVINQPRSAGKTSQARSAVRELRKAGYVWADGEWQAPFLTITVPDCDEEALRRAFANNKQGGRLLPYVEKYIRKGLGQMGNPTAPQAQPADALTPAAFALPPKAITANLMRDDSGERPMYCLMAAYPSEADARAALATLSAVLAEVQAEPVELQMCSELKPRTDSEKAAYLAGVADGRMYAERDAARDNVHTLQNPLISDADCARLEADMAIDVCWSSSDVSAYARYHSTNQGAHETFRLHGGDKQKARRHAVTRLLSKIQMNKQAQ